MFITHEFFCCFQILNHSSFFRLLNSIANVNITLCEGYRCKIVLFFFFSFVISWLFSTLIFHILMLFYRRRLFISCFILLLLTIQLLVHIFHVSECDSDNNIPPLPPEIAIDKNDIINLNTKILCWIPTTIARLDRALVVYE